MLELSSAFDWYTYKKYRSTPIQVIIPVYSQYDLVERCLEAVYRTIPANVVVRLIDDCSPDYDLQKWRLEKFKRQGLEVVHRARNGGFTIAANEGLQGAGGADVVLLNSDALVSGAWIYSLARWVQFRPDIGSVTPLSTSHGAFNYGGPFHTPKLDLREIRSLTNKVRRNFPKSGFEIPTCNGFCVYIRNDALKDVGIFDAQRYPRGFGEENDWSMRARSKGWQHILDLSTLVHHQGGASYDTQERVELMKIGRSKLDEDWPQYSSEVQRWFTDPRMRAVWSENQMHEYDRPEGPRVVRMYPKVTGGLHENVETQIASLKLSTEQFCVELSEEQITVQSGPMGSPPRVIKIRERPTFTPQVNKFQLDFFAELSLTEAPDVVHLHHLLFTNPETIVEWQTIAPTPIIYTLHDRYLLCPTGNLVTDAGTFCSGFCSNTPGERCAAPSFVERGIPTIKGQQVSLWRKRVGEFLQKVDAVISPSASILREFLGFYDEFDTRKCHVIAPFLFESFDEPRAALNDVTVSSTLIECYPLKIGFIGRLSTKKGFNQLRRVVDSMSVPVEVHIFGRVDPALRETVPGTWIQHGHIKRKDLAKTLSSIKFDYGFCATPGGETWGHAASLWASVGVPIIYTAEGSLDERSLGSRNIRMEPDHFWRTVTELDESWERGIPSETTGHKAGLKSAEPLLSVREHFNLYRGLSEAQLEQNSAGESTDANKLKEPPDYVIYPKGYQGDRAVGSAWVRLIGPLSDITSAVPLLLTAGQMITNTGQRVIVQRDAVLSSNSKVDQKFFEDHDVIFDLDDNLFEVRKSRGITPDLVGMVSARILGAREVVVSTVDLQERIWERFRIETRLRENRLSRGVYSKGLNWTDFRGLWRKTAEENLDTLASVNPNRLGSLRPFSFGTNTHTLDLDLWSSVSSESTALPTLVYYGEGARRVRNVSFDAVNRGRTNYPAFVEDLKKISENFDLGIALLVNDSFNRYKSVLKVLELNALGLPTICSNVPAFKNSTRYEPVFAALSDDGTITSDDLQQFCSFARNDPATLLSRMETLLERSFESFLSLEDLRGEF